MGSPGRRPISNRSWFLKAYPTGLPQENLFELRQSQINPNVDENAGDVLVKVLYFSLDPHMRNQMRVPEGEHAQGYGGFSLNEPLLAPAIGVVKATANSSFKTGDLVQGTLGWEDYSLVRKAEGLSPLEPSGLPPSYYLGPLGYQGLTAYAGLLDIGAPQAGETVYVSSAFGVVGQIAGQLAKLKGAVVVGSAGSAEKVEQLTTTFGFDRAFNYKDEPDLSKALAKYCPDGIDVYYENVGGRMLEAVLANANAHARIVVCGMVSQYNLEEKEGIRNIIQLIAKRIKMQGFLVNDYFGTPLEAACKREVAQWLREGRIKYKEDVADGLNSAAKAFVGLLQGKSMGKVVVRIADA